MTRTDILDNDGNVIGWQECADGTATADDIAAHRYAIETGGVSVTVSTGTHAFDTRREIEARWLKLQLAAMGNPAFTQSWKTLDHGFVTLTADDVLTITNAVEAHVLACFNAEGALLLTPPEISELPTAFSAALANALS